MKLVFLSREYPPETSWGGESVVIHNLSKAMAKCGHEIHVICQANTQKKEVVQDGVIVHRVGNNSKRYSAVAKIDYSIFAYFKLLQIIKKRKIDLVDAPYWSAEGFLFSFTKQIPLVVRTQSSPSDALRTKTFSGIMQFINLKLLNMLAKITAQKADKIISN
ncbi:MAG TPA: glycosyltransferase family 4 protein, partial [Dehalococcoidales bacterium]|nr:glycosyltransferase family 4 protein [Dehalococcoidales bacterium]